MRHKITSIISISTFLFSLLFIAIFNKTRTGYKIINFLKITALSTLILVSAADASPFAYVTNNNNDNVSVIDTATNNVTATVDVGSLPNGVAVTPDGTKAYVMNGYGGTVSVIDAATNKVTNTVKVGVFPEGITVNPDGTKVYVTNSQSNTTSVIDTATNIVTATVPVGEYPIAIGIGPVTKKERGSIPAQASKDAPFISPIWALVAVLGTVACVKKMK